MQQLYWRLIFCFCHAEIENSTVRGFGLHAMHRRLLGPREKFPTKPSSSSEIIHGHFPRGGGGRRRRSNDQWERRIWSRGRRGRQWETAQVDQLRVCERLDNFSQKFSPEQTELDEAARLVASDNNYLSQVSTLILKGLPQYEMTSLFYILIVDIMPRSGIESFPP